MKGFRYFDILFIVIFAGFYSGITFLGYSEILSRYALIFSLIAYFLGKLSGRIEFKSKYK